MSWRLVKVEINDQPHHIRAGWHEIEIDVAKQFWHERPESILFVVEGTVLRSTAPDFAGKRVAYVCRLVYRGSADQMLRIAEVSRDVGVRRVADEALQRSRYGWPENLENTEAAASAKILANAYEVTAKKSGHKIVLVDFQEAV